MHPSSARPRGFAWHDALLLALIAGAVAWLVHRASTDLRYSWNWATVGTFLVRWDPEKGRWVANLLVQGFLMTLRLAFWGIVLAAPIGVLMGLARVSQDLFLRMVSRGYVELVRNSPPLVLLFILYFFVSGQVTPYLGVDEFARTASPGARLAVEILFCPPQLLTAFVSALLCLALFEGAYLTEIVRAGIQSVERGQWEAAGSLGLGRWAIFRLVVLPQAVARVLPPLASQFISLVKESSIVSIVSIQELTFMANEVAVTSGRIFEIWITASAMYFAACFGLSLVFRHLEARAARSRR